MDKLNLNFGLIIAYFIPGFLGLYSVSSYSIIIKSLLGGDSYVPNVSAIIPLLLMSIAVGIILSVIAWAIVRPLIELVAIKRPSFDYSKLHRDDIEIFREFIGSMFRYYQCYSNLLIVFLIFILNYAYNESTPKISILIVLGFLIVILFLAARDALVRSYKTMDNLLTK